ncbi:hypothetical protein NDU88_011191 [Pleurodeles waltl]|uniref:Uncharacterized protein n=1 Tax=Pleurodeles waltl TaxID=8319 RepID=A0AAV7QWI7_PLEWA|nr:hypothetical protein NDU88_011191 [Pleurodeles waltl]
MEQKLRSRYVTHLTDGERGRKEKRGNERMQRGRAPSRGPQRGEAARPREKVDRAGLLPSGLPEAHGNRAPCRCYPPVVC